MNAGHCAWKLIGANGNGILKSKFFLKGRKKIEATLTLATNRPTKEGAECCLKKQVSWRRQKWREAPAATEVAVTEVLWLANKTKQHGTDTKKIRALFKRRYWNFPRGSAEEYST
jgi:hypothetical protein